MLRQLQIFGTAIFISSSVLKSAHALPENCIMDLFINRDQKIRVRLEMGGGGEGRRVAEGKTGIK